jgi:hypothetical protein
MTKSSLSKICDLVRLGILSLTWTSEHYELESVKLLLSGSGFEIVDIQHIGSHVYERLAAYYIHNRTIIKNIILKEKTTTTYYHDILYEVIERVVYNTGVSCRLASIPLTFSVPSSYTLFMSGIFIKFTKRHQFNQQEKPASQLLSNHQIVFFKIPTILLLHEPNPQSPTTKVESHFSFLFILTFP